MYLASKPPLVLEMVSNRGGDKKQKGTLNEIHPENKRKDFARGSAFFLLFSRPEMLFSLWKTPLESQNSLRNKNRVLISLIVKDFGFRDSNS